MQQAVAEREGMLSELKTQTAELAVDIAGKILERKSRRKTTSASSTAFSTRSDKVFSLLRQEAMNANLGWLELCLSRTLARMVCAKNPNSFVRKVCLVWR